MFISLAEEAESGMRNESSFTKDVVLAGRDANECDIAFDAKRFPMVSRKHGAFHWMNGLWYIEDLGSSYGTFLNGVRVSYPRELEPGSVVQFGENGPKIRVISFEQVRKAEPEPAAAPPPEPARIIPDPTPAVWDSAPKVPAPSAAATPPSQAGAELEFVSDRSRSPFQIKSASVWLGRDPSCDIVFDATSATVSRRHAEIRLENGQLLLADNNSFNGTLVNGTRISGVRPLASGDEVQLGSGGPILRVHAGAGKPQKPPSSPQFRAEDRGQRTMVLKLDPTGGLRTSEPAAQLILSRAIPDGGAITVGRGEGCEVRLDGLQISNRHARFSRSGQGIVVEDLGSTNGTFVNGSRTAKQQIATTDVVQIGSFTLRVDAAGTLGVFDARSKTRIDVVAVSCDVKGRLFGPGARLIDSVSLSIQPNEFIGLLGPSGAGKSTLMEAMSGVRPATEGSVLFNSLDLKSHFHSLKQSIGYVPQDDIIHRELSVYRTLYHVARLRLSKDASSAEIRKTIDEVLDVTGLADRRDLPVSKLSGGQRKRVSIAVELLTRPSAIFLDEPTSGLDPATEFRIMQLFRQIAESGRTVVMTTHAMENVAMFDKIAVLMLGKLVYFGPPDDALSHFGVATFRELYDKLEEPVEREAADRPSADRSAIAGGVAETWRRKFASTPVHRQYVEEPLKQLGAVEPSKPGKSSRLGVFGSIRQFFTLSRRYFEVLAKDKLNLAVIFLQAPIIALMTFLVMGREQPRDFVYFILAIVSIWFGTAVAAREIIRERPVYRRERMFNLGIIPYLASKLFVLGLIVSVQCFLLFGPLKFFDAVGLMPMPGELFGVPQLWATLLTGLIGVALGLFVSTVVRTSEMATSLVPLILVPQILFSGIVGVPAGISKVVGLTMPSSWSFDTIKRFSTLDTLEEEGADISGPTKGLGLYKFIETENDKLLEKAERDIENYKRLGPDGVSPGEPDPLGERLKVPEIKKVPSDLSGYITFLHPWMSDVLNQLVLMLMFLVLVFSSLIALRLKDLK
ncbi:MAG: FHA domain-containing protein [Acidobacteria bacterium]|nr:FHA domain-containing protein [Acidobacteriota bacterium]